MRENGPTDREAHASLRCTYMGHGRCTVSARRFFRRGMEADGARGGARGGLRPSDEALPPHEEEVFAVLDHAHFRRTGPEPDRAAASAGGAVADRGPTGVWSPAGRS